MACIYSQRSLIFLSILMFDENIKGLLCQVKLNAPPLPRSIQWLPGPVVYFHSLAFSILNRYNPFYFIIVSQNQQVLLHRATMFFFTWRLSWRGPVPFVDRMDYSSTSFKEYINTMICGSRQLYTNDDICIWISNFCQQILHSEPLSKPVPV